MKKITIILAATIAALSFSSCKKDEIPSSNESKGNLIINIDVANPGAETKAVKTGWVSGDKINIWYDSNTNLTTSGKPDLVIKYDGSSWAKDGSATLSGKSPKSEGGTLKVVYEATNDWLNTFNQESSNVYPTAKIADTHLGSAYQMPMTVISNTTYTYDSGTEILTADISSWTFATNVQIVVTGLNSADAANYVLGCGDLKIKYISFGSIGVYANDNSNIKCVMGVANADGVAFNFYRSSSMTDKSFTFYLYDKATKVEKTVTLSNKTLTVADNKCQSIRISKDKFSTVSGFVKDGFAYTVTNDKAKLERCNYFGGSDLYTGSITIPATVSVNGNDYTVTTIGDRAFYNCTSVTSVTIPEGIKNISAYAFVKTGLTTLSLPASLEYIDDGNPVFNNSSSLYSVTVADGNTKFFVENDILYYKKASASYMVMFVPESKTGGIVLNANTTKIASNGTLVNTNASSIEFPAGFGAGANFEPTWGQFQGTINDGLELKFNYETYSAFTAAYGTTWDIYNFGRFTENSNKIVVSFPSTLSDADLASLKTWFGGEGSLKVKEVKRRS